MHLEEIEDAKNDFEKENAKLKAASLTDSTRAAQRTGSDESDDVVVVNEDGKHLDGASIPHSNGPLLVINEDGKPLNQPTKSTPS